MYQNTQQTWACYPPTEIAHFGHSALKDMFGGVSLHFMPFHATWRLIPLSTL